MTVLTLYIEPQTLKISIIGSKLTYTHRVTYQNLCERGTNPMEKELAPLGFNNTSLEKNPKYIQENYIFGFFLGFFSWLVSPIELILIHKIFSAPKFGWIFGKLSKIRFCYYKR